jgi:chromosome segregation ATPase
MEELTVTGDDLQQYQVQIRRFEEGLAEANGRYERLEKKAVVLDQTVTGIDRAFDALREAESAIAEHRAALSSMPSEVESLKKSLDELLGSRDQVNLTVERISALDGILSDVEKRTEKMQTAREWLARTETRLEEISRKSEEQLKLLADVLKEDGASRKTKGAPPIGIRENVVKLAHQGWKVDEIARALHLSRGEVELILELPQK